MVIPDLTTFPFNIVDLLLGLVFLLSVWRGWRAGFLAGVVQLGCLAAGLLAAFYGTPHLAGPVAEAGWLEEPWASPVAFLLIFVLVQLVVSGLAYRAIRPGITGRAARAVNQGFGVLPGAVNGLIHAMVVALLLTAVPLNDTIARAADSSRAVDLLTEPTDQVEALLGPIFQPAVERTLRTITVPPESNRTYVLPFAVARAEARPELEAQMLVLVNAEREKAGVRLLVPDPETVEVSRAHSRDMFARSYFSHSTPEGRSPFDRLRAARLGFRAAGENLALSPNLKQAHQGLMNSPGHRANILNPAFGRLGVGIVDGGRRGLMVTQTFRN